MVGYKSGRSNVKIGQPLTKVCYSAGRILCAFGSSFRPETLEPPSTLFIMPCGGRFEGDPKKPKKRLGTFLVLRSTKRNVRSEDLEIKIHQKGEIKGVQAPEEGLCGAIHRGVPVIAQEGPAEVDKWGPNKAKRSSLGVIPREGLWQRKMELRRGVSWRQRSNRLDKNLPSTHCLLP